jgi:ribosomal protein S18 acetylase RimI-like enzyme
LEIRYRIYYFFIVANLEKIKNSLAKMSRSIAGMDYRIHFATLDSSDAADLVPFGKREFTRTFGPKYSKENLELYLHEWYTVEKFQTWIGNPKYRIWMARKLDTNEVLGYILCGPCGLPLELCEGNWNASISGEVKRLYLGPETFGAGLAQKLMDIAMSWLKEQYEDRIFVGCDSENPRGLRFYTKYGFRQIGEYDFNIGHHVDKEYIFTFLP